MRWEDEHWVKLYTRDTLDWDALGWEAQAVWFFVFRKLDASGVLDLGKGGTKGLAARLGMPIDIFTRALNTCLQDGCIVQRDGLLVMPNYLEAQEARKSDRLRQKESRERARDKALSRNVTENASNVTQSDGDVVSRDDCRAERHVSTATSAEEKRGEEKRREETLPARVATGGPIRPRTAHELICRLRVAVEREQPQNGMWNPGGSFHDRDARVFLEGFADLEAALENIERRIDLFARDPGMEPWTVEKFSKQYNAIGQPKRGDGRKGAPAPVTYPKFGE